MLTKSSNNPAVFIMKSICKRKYILFLGDNAGCQKQGKFLIYCSGPRTAAVAHNKL